MVNPSLKTHDRTVDDADVARFSAIAEEWWDTQGKFKPLHRINPLRIGYIRDQALRHFGVQGDHPTPLKGLKILDIGCGGGLICEPLTRLGAQVTGIDASEKNIGVASTHAAQGGLDIDYRCLSVETLAEVSPAFDVVCTLEVIEHVADVDAFMKAACSLVKPGGLLFFSTLNRTAKSFALAIVGAEYLLRWVPRGTHDWKKFVTPAEATRLVRQNGCTTRHITGMVMSPLTWEWSLDERDASVNYLLCATK